MEMTNDPPPRYPVGMASAFTLRRTNPRYRPAVLVLLVVAIAGILSDARAAGAGAAATPFPPSLDSYADSHMTSVRDVLVHRVKQQPFNLAATLLFLAAIVHTGMAYRFRRVAHRMEDAHRERRRLAELAGRPGSVRRVCGPARLLHYLGEVEVIFGIWVLPLLVAMNLAVGPAATFHYFHDTLSFTEPIFVVVIMTMAATRPILRLAEQALHRLARIGGGTPAAWWLSILLVGPLLGSLITEPAAMTICALLLSRKVYAFKPGARLGYATLGLLFVSISTGGTLTHFAAPPVLMVAGAWGWDTAFMLTQFGWKAAAGIAISTAAYFLLFRGEIRKLGATPAAVPEAAEEPIPVWVNLGHVAFMSLAVMCAHQPVFLVLSLLFFIAFVEVTEEFHRDFTLRPPVLVGFFLAGLVVHGGLQQWWIAPLLGSLRETSLFVGAMGLTAFNDNAAITYLCTLVPSFTDTMKYAAMAGAVVGGGLTVIANAPNPAGQSMLNKHFEDGISAGGLFLGALLPTVVQAAVFLLLRP